MNVETTRAETPSDDGESDDTVSLTDTVHSVVGEEQVWDLEKIIAESEFEELAEDGTVYSATNYLLKWKGYSIYRSTWETGSHLVDGAPETFRAWQETQMRVVRGFADPFDVDAWEAKKDARDMKRIRRHEKRNRKRVRLSLPVVNYDEENEDNTDAGQASSNDEQIETLEVENTTSDGEPVFKRTRKMPADDSSGEDMADRSPNKRKRRTAEQMEREREHTRMLLKRRKGVAIPVDKNKTITKSMEKTSVVTKPLIKAPGSLVKSSTPATTKPVSGQTGAIKVTPQTTYFQSLTRPKPLKIQVPKLIRKDASTPITSQSAQSMLTTPTSAHLQPAPIARMVGGPSRISKKPVSMTGGTASHNTNIFANISKPVTHRKRVDTGLYKSVSHRHNAQKAAQQENIPVLEDLVLVDPATGKPLRTVTKKTNIRSDATNASGSRLTLRTRAQTPTGSVIDEDEAFRQKHASQAVVEMNLQANFQASDNESTPSLNQKNSGDYTKTCFWWATRGYCAWGLGCPFPHRDDDGPVQSCLDMKAQIMCMFWAEGKCDKPEALCEYAHSHKTFTSSMGRVAPTRSKDGRPSLVGGALVRNDEVYTSWEVPSNRMMCRFWFLDGVGCRKSAEACTFAHYLCRYIAPFRTLADSVPLSERSPVAIQATRAMHMRATNVDLPAKTTLPLLGTPPSDHLSSVTPATPSASTSPTKSFPAVGTRRTRFDILPPSSSTSTAIALPPSHNVSLSKDSVPQIISRSMTEPSLGSQVSNVPVSHSSSSALPQPSLQKSKSLVIYPSVSSHPPKKTPRPKTAQISLHPRTVSDAFSATLCFFHGEEIEPQLRCDISMIGLPTSVRRELGVANSQIEIRNVCTSESASVLYDAVRYPSRGSGDVLPADTSTIEVDILIDHLTLNSVAALFCHPHFNILFFPVRQDIWRRLQPDRTLHPEAKLHFQILGPAIPTPPANFASSMSLDNLSVVVLRITFELDMDRLFTWASGDLVDKAVFLMFPLQNQHETRLIKACFSDYGAKVYESNEPMSWYRFCSDNKNGGVVLFHPDFYAYEEIPSFVARLLKVGRFNLFQITLRENGGHFGEPMNDIGTTFTLTRLFPHGRAVLISDSSFSANPADTLVVVKSIVDRIKPQPMTTKLLGRPGLLRWLYDLAITEHEHQRDSLFYSEDDTRMDTYVTLANVLEADPHYIMRPPAPPRPTPISPIYFLHEDDMPEYAELARENPREAENIMAAWFADWARSHVREFRRFLIIHTGDMKKLWSERYKHIEVLTPHQYLVDNPVMPRRPSKNK